MACLFPMHFCELDYTLSRGKALPCLHDGVCKQVFTHLLRFCDGVSKRLNQRQLYM